MRKPRILVDGAKYHVSARANRQELIFQSDAMKSLFQEVLVHAKKKYSFRLDNFCIMGNHFHLIIQPNPGVSLSAIMQWVLSVFAQLWNRHHGLTGHLWGERFYSRVLETFVDLFQTSQYIDQNPVQAGLVHKVTDWLFGGVHQRQQGLRIILDEPDAPGIVANMGTELR